MKRFVEMIEAPVPEGTPVQYLGVYVTDWQPEWDATPDRFSDEPIQVHAFRGSDELDALLAACRKLIEQYDSSPDCTLGGNLTNGPFLEIRKALKVIDKRG